MAGGPNGATVKAMGDKKGSRMPSTVVVVSRVVNEQNVLSQL